MDTWKLDELMRRASKIDTDDRKKKQQMAKAVRDEYREIRQRLKAAEAQLEALAPRAAYITRYINEFRWDRVRPDGRMHTDVKDRLKELNSSMTGGLISIRGDIRKIDEFNENDLAGTWRPSKDVGGSLSNTTNAEQMLGALERDMEFWTQKLEENLIASGYGEAIEGERPQGEGVVTPNIRPGD